MMGLDLDAQFDGTDKPVYAPCGGFGSPRFSARKDLKKAVRLR